MKSLAEYLTESEKTYFFKIGIAGEVPEKFQDSIETDLQKFGLKNMTSGKRTPIQERPMDFPNLQNIEVTYYEVELAYPTTNQVLEQYISQCSQIPQAHVRVVDPYAQDKIAAGDQTGDARTEDEGPYEALLNSDYKDPISSDAAQQNVGANKVMDLLKELEQARKEREHDPMRAVVPGDSKDIENVENATSVIGS